MSKAFRLFLAGATIFAASVMPTKASSVLEEKFTKREVANMYAVMNAYVTYCGQLKPESDVIFKAISLLVDRDLIQTAIVGVAVDMEEKGGKAAWCTQEKIANILK